MLELLADPPNYRLARQARSPGERRDCAAGDDSERS
jgi:hypothetical protein